MRILFKHKEALSRLAKELKKTFPELSLQETRRLVAIVSGYRNEKELVNSLTDREQTEFPIWSPEYLASFSSRIPENIDMNKLMGFCCAFLSAKPEHPLMTEPLKHELSQISSGMIFVSGGTATGVTTLLCHVLHFLKSQNKKIILIGFRNPYVSDKAFNEGLKILEFIEYPYQDTIMIDGYSLKQVHMTMREMENHKDTIFLTSINKFTLEKAYWSHEYFSASKGMINSAFCIEIKGGFRDSDRHAYSYWRNTPEAPGSIYGLLSRKLSEVISGLTSGEIIYARPVTKSPTIIPLGLREIRNQLFLKEQSKEKYRFYPHTTFKKMAGTLGGHIDIRLTTIEAVDEYKEYLACSGQDKRNRVWIYERENGKLDVELDMFY